MMDKPVSKSGYPIVCGPAAFVVLKAHAFHNRAEPKDAYDLVYVLKHYGSGNCREVAAHFSAVATMPSVGEAVEFLAADFASPEHHGASRAAAFHGGGGADARAEAFGYVQELLSLIRAAGVRW